MQFGRQAKSVAIKEEGDDLLVLPLLVHLSAETTLANAVHGGFLVLERLYL